MPHLPPTRAPRVTRSRIVAGATHVVWRHVVGSDWLGFGDEPSAGDRVRVDDPFGTGPRDARVTRVEEGRALHLEWWPAGRPDDRSEVAIAIEPAGGGTRVTITESALPTGDVAARGRLWSSCMQALAGAVDRASSPFVRSVR